ncbi:hypothetical protein HYH03_006978 [Edaphochlamys debaryana]|uniref:Uncharacterized protein n=1 Tax=Edaphochlamys debaryana TaxID=47281 RepID=A0A835Y1X7_9CHLO|nr:hypothetical protein HYH03_006978 [Edaphochlamys debaryana]|eukprot:KAG2495047.1 hypothetical protein HYH03_006978 [Edaphochlamys debaryana]
MLLLCVMLLIASLNMGCAPVYARLLLRMEYASLMVLSLTITLGLYFVDTGPAAEDLRDQGVEDALGIIIVIMNLGLLLIFTALIAQASWPKMTRLQQYVGKLREAVRSTSARVKSCCTHGPDPEAPTDKYTTECLGASFAQQTIAAHAAGACAALESDASDACPEPDFPPAEEKGPTVAVLL